MCGKSSYAFAGGVDLDGNGGCDLGIGTVDTDDELDRMAVLLSP